MSKRGVGFDTCQTTSQLASSPPAARTPPRRPPPDDGPAGRAGIRAFRSTAPASHARPTRRAQPGAPAVRAARRRDRRRALLRRARRAHRGGGRAGRRGRRSKRPNCALWAEIALGALHAGAAVTGIGPGADAARQLALTGAQLVDAPPRGPRRDGVPYALLPCSSGTTGLPKAVMLTHANLAAGVAQIRAGLRFTEDDVVLGVAPFAHVMGFVGALTAPLAAGATVVIAAGFDLGADRRHRVTVLIGPPPVAQALLADDPRPVHRSQLVVIGGAPLAPALHDRLAERLPHAASRPGLRDDRDDARDPDPRPRRPAPRRARPGGSRPSTRAARRRGRRAARARPAGHARLPRRPGGHRRADRRRRLAAHGRHRLRRRRRIRACHRPPEGADQGQRAAGRARGARGAPALPPARRGRGGRRPPGRAHGRGARRGRRAARRRSTRGARGMGRRAGRARTSGSPPSCSPTPSRAPRRASCCGAS